MAFTGPGGLIMATKKVGIYRKYHGAVPTDSYGKPLPKDEWPKKRAFRWAVRWFGSDGKRYSKSFETRKEAEEFADGKQPDVRIGKGDAPPVTTIGDFAKKYIEIRTDLSESSRREHEGALKALRQYFGDQRQIGKITPLDARSFISSYHKRTKKGIPLSPATVNKIIRECKRIFREALECQLISINPFTGIRQQKVGQVDWHYVSASEYQRLMNACPSLLWKGIIALAYCCGLRRGEIINLTWSDIDFEKEMLKVVRKHAASGTKAWMPKDKDMRVVPLSRGVVNILTQLQNAAKDGQLYVFVNGRGLSRGMPVKGQNTWRDFQVIRRRAGLPEFSIHDLRKTYCTNLSAAIPMHVVKELAGHSDIRTTQKYYVKVQPELIEKARKAVELFVAENESN
jgi:integrase